MKDKVAKEKLERYFDLTGRGLEKVRVSVVEGREEDAREIIEMVENYLSDARHFEGEGDIVNAFAALAYAHGWLDCGVRLGIFDVEDPELFVG